jgi:hypothetical protein
MDTNQTTSEIAKLVKELTKQPIAVQPIYKKLTGSWSAAVLLSQVMYWYGKMDRAIYKTDEEFMEELCMTEKEFRIAKEHLKSVPFVRVFRAGNHGQMHYEINYELFVSTMKHCIEKLTCPNGRNAQKGITSAQKGETAPLLICPKGRNLYTETNISENTTETTAIASENQTPKPSPNSPKVSMPLKYTDDFSAFWALYGIGSKACAFSAWKKQNPSAEEQAAILACVPVYKAYCASADRSLKDGQGWLNGRFWENTWTHQAQNTKPSTNQKPFEAQPVQINRCPSF